MEWQGIDISGNRQQKWRAKSLNSLLWLGVSFLFSILIAVLLTYFSLTFSKEKAGYQQQNNALSQQQEQIERQIAQIKNRNSFQTERKYLNKEAVTQFIHYLSEFSVQGAIDISQLYVDDKKKIKLIGKAFNHREFEQITHQLKQKEIQYQIDNFQTNDKSQIEFNITLFSKDDENE